MTAALWCPRCGALLTECGCHPDWHEVRDLALYDAELEDEQ